MSATKHKVRGKPVARQTAAAKSAATGEQRSEHGVAGGRSLTGEALHRDMVDYAKEMTASKAAARAFLKRIGAPVKA